MFGAFYFAQPYFAEGPRVGSGDVPPVPPSPITPSGVGGGGAGARGRRLRRFEVPRYRNEQPRFSDDPPEQRTDDWLKKREGIDAADEEDLMLAISLWMSLR